MFIGSTAARVVRVGDIPVLVVSRKTTRPYQRLVIAVDLEDTSRSIVEAALRIVGPDINAATLMHAYHIPFEGFIKTSVSAAQMAEFQKEYKQTAASSM
jgi:hypothetical protein